MYEVYLERAACGDLDRLPGGLFEPMTNRIGALARNPRPVGCRKLSGSDNDWRIRVGDYRVIYEIHDAAKRISVMRVKHRREAYR